MVCSPVLYTFVYSDYLLFADIQGAVQGPEEFAEGLALGVRSLFGHAVGKHSLMYWRLYKDYKCYLSEASEILFSKHSKSCLLRI